ncbi:MAG TPA: hypothetical protein VGT41_00885 [Candidatus Babeliales bacterium]|nr:hypothetical protein [Candidatus Babeliales bacterium]
MRIVRFLLMLLLCFNSHNSFSAAEPAPVDIDPTIQQLLIFLDDSEPYYYNTSEPKYDHHLRAVTKTAAKAIKDLAGSILISGSLLYNLLREPKKYDREKHIFNNFYKDFNSNDWIIRKVNSTEDQKTQLYLMIPTGYLGILPDDLRQLNIKNPITELEYGLGLKIEHMDTIPSNTNQELRDYFTAQYNSYTMANFSELQNAAGGDFIKNCINEKKLFVSQSDYLKRGQDPAKWIIYLMGHGGYNTHIAYLSLKNFDLLLRFLEKDILTIFFAYNSCYGAGFNTQQVFGELMAKGGARTLPFPIVTQALTDAPVVAPDTINFNSFINTLLYDPSDYRKAIAYIMPTTSSIKSTPQIKLPNVPAWFPITKLDNALIRITKIKSATRKKSLTVNEKPVLLYTNYVPFLINFPSDAPELLISMIPGNAVHIIDKVAFVDRLTIQNFFSKMDNIEYGSSKLFFIKTVQIGNLSNITNMIIDYKPNKKPVFFFTENGQQKNSFWDEESALKNDYMKAYEQVLQNTSPEPIAIGAKKVEEVLEKKLRRKNIPQKKNVPQKAKL